MATAIPTACLARSAIRCRDVETGPTLGGLAVFPSNWYRQDEKGPRGKVKRDPESHGRQVSWHEQEAARHCRFA